jgi:hypothetical protein
MAKKVYKDSLANKVSRAFKVSKASLVLRVSQDLTALRAKKVRWVFLVTSVPEALASKAHLVWTV